MQPQKKRQSSARCHDTSSGEFDGDCDQAIQRRTLTFYVATQLADRVAKFHRFCFQQCWIYGTVRPAEAAGLSVLSNVYRHVTIFDLTLLY
jgi:hypothetical protein